MVRSWPHFLFTDSSDSWLVASLIYFHVHYHCGATFIRLFFVLDLDSALRLNRAKLFLFLVSAKAESHLFRSSVDRTSLKVSSITLVTSGTNRLLHLYRMALFITYLFSLKKKMNLYPKSLAESIKISFKCKCIKIVCWNEVKTFTYHFFLILC